MKNIILIVTDTLRQDHLPSYGSDTVIAPNLGAFGEKGIVFENFHAASFPTAPARADLTTGRYTFTYRDWGPLRADEPALAEILHEAGYVTCGIGDTPFLIRYGYGYDRGFEQYIWFRGQRQGPDREDVIKQRAREEDYFAPQTFKAAAEWLERNHEDPFFLYIDTWDPHEPWDPPHYYVTPYYPDYKGEDIYPCYWDWEDHGMTAEQLAIAHACYYGEISMIDRWFGVLMERLQTLNLMDDTIVIFLADHGFYFGEFGIFGKSRFRWPDNTISVSEAMVKYRLGAYSHRSPLHNEITKVPLLMHIPGEQHQRINKLTTMPDIMPTILDIAGVATPEKVQGNSLLPLINGETEFVHDMVVTSQALSQFVGGSTKIVDDKDRKIVELSPSTIRTEEWDLLFTVAGEPVELYDAKTDPKHQYNLAESKPEIVEDVHQQFLTWLEALDTPSDLIAPRRKLK